MFSISCPSLDREVLVLMSTRQLASMTNTPHGIVMEFECPCGAQGRLPDRERGDAKPRLRDLLDHLGTIEAMWSLAVASVEHQWSYPTPGSEFRVAGLVHPFLAVAAVPNVLAALMRVHGCQHLAAPEFVKAADPGDYLELIGRFTDISEVDRQNVGAVNVVDVAVAALRSIFSGDILG
jgi:hypothetical protein